MHETVYENRFEFAAALVKMGADIVVHPHGLQDEGRAEFRAAARAGRGDYGPDGPARRRYRRARSARQRYSHVIALTARRSRVSGVDILSRGYEKFLDKLSALGADSTSFGDQWLPLNVVGRRCSGRLRQW